MLSNKKVIALNVTLVASTINIADGGVPVNAETVFVGGVVGVAAWIVTVPLSSSLVVSVG